VAAGHGDVLELGFGLGIAARHIQRLGVKSHTVLEANPDVVRTIHEWRRRESIALGVIEGRWSDLDRELGSYDGILFDTYPTSWAEQTDAYLMDTMRRLRAHLRSGGVLAYFWRYHRAVPEATRPCSAKCSARSCSDASRAFRRRRAVTTGVTTA
jgi:guanidinoacetate N-methyltransferase